MIRALIPIYSITLIDVFGYMVMIPLLPYLAQKYGASGLEVGALLAVMAVASTVAAPLWGALSDKVGRKPIVTVSQVISLIGYLLVAWAPSLGMLFVARTVAGIGGGNLAVTQSYISDVTDDSHRDKAFAAFGVVFGLGIVLGPIAGGFLVKYGFWLPFVVSAAIEAVNIGLTLKFLPKTKRKSKDEFNLKSAAKEVWTQPRTGSLIVRHFLFIFAVTYFFSIFALYLKHALNLGPEKASWLFAAAGAIGAIALAAAVGPLAKRLGDAWVAQLGFALSAVAYAVLAFAHNLWALLGMLALWAVGASCVEPTIAALISESASAEKRGAILGFNDAMSSLALMAAPSLGGWIIDKNVALTGLVPGIAVLGALGLGILRRREDVTLATGGAPSP
ncbi:MAG TPA: MFS transporter [Candidatus Cybelea sp.]|nr:MFS transporter [Candidatus Cybelea sp.]